MKIHEEELTIYEVEKLHKEILTHFKEDTLHIDMSAVRKIDMSVIQLFVSAQKTSLKNNKTFELQGLSDEVKAILSQCACEFLMGDSNG